MDSASSKHPNVHDPCHDDLMEYLKCVREHPHGLKWVDCENAKSIYRECMKLCVGLNIK